ncbi:MAG: N-acetylmuramoyl-L-alanine amidase [Sphaerobacteraceae bacterium]|nr:MAG: N-acetylmuramoyl-L-alanine amidase [Sphaerobacteraceae bacterium]
MLTDLFKERIDRRSILKVAGGLMLASIFDLHRTPGGQAEMTRMRWLEQGVFPESGTYRSPVFRADQTFESVEVGWHADVPDGAGISIHVRTSSDGEQWTEWHHLHEDTHMEPEPGARIYAMPHITGPSNYVQYELYLAPSSSGATPQVHEVEIGCVDTSPAAQFMSVGGNLIDGWIVPRAGWGANENLRYSNGSETWTPRHAPIQKAIVHHTVTSTGGADPAAVIRSMYYYHAVTLGWGDIGYNFLVDQNGNAYEGRYGGPTVTGAHTAGNNTATIGVAAIGTFSSASASQAAINSIGRLIGKRASHLDPHGSSSFNGRNNVPNIGAHRDYMATNCPGQGLYQRLPDIRSIAANYRGSSSEPPPSSEPEPPPPPTASRIAEIVDARFSPQQLYAGSTMRVDITIRNISNQTLHTQGPSPQHVYMESDTFLMAYPDRTEGRIRVGVDFDGNSGLPSPWRWGLPGSLAPGETTTVTGFVQLDSTREWNLSVSLINELVRYEEQGKFETTVVTSAPPTNPTERDNDPSMHYFEVTRHNVPAIFYRYWEENGGLRRFGYPLTEAIMELSETDGETYLTQYFERARFEHHPEFAGTEYEVLLGLLGTERTRDRMREPAFDKVAEPADTDAVDWYMETGHTLRGVFRDYWWDNGGLPIYGFPISEEFEEVSKTDGHTYTVQYFERNRFEWHPEHAGTEYEVLLGHLAREILIDRGWLTPEY